MAGAAPPPNAPPPTQQSAARADAGFAPSPIGASLCGFGLPSFNFNLSISLPFRFPPAGFPPDLNFSIGLKCDLSDPLDAHFGFGGGRVSQADTNADPDTTENL